MTANLMSMPRYKMAQMVSFAGGVGKIKNCKLDSKMWVYAVEMEMGPEPEMGRIGPETTILLHEADIYGVCDVNYGFGEMSLYHKISKLYSESYGTTKQ